MTDALKIAVKTGLIVIITAGIVAIFATIQLPAPDFSGVYTALSKALALVDYWLPVLSQLWRLVLALMGIRIAIWLYELSMIAVRWIMKVNE